MEWSLDKPKEDGYYWVCSDTEPTFMIYVLSAETLYQKFGTRYLYKTTDLPLYEYAYFGPIHPPPIPMMLGKE